MTMALAVALVACSAATSVKGEQGAKGAQGEQGPAGPAGTTDNDPPMLKEGMELPMVYLALAGSGMKDPSDALDLNKYFEDRENATLKYTFSSNADDVAIAKFMDGSTSKMIVDGKKAGTATITVMAHDGVNVNPTTTTFDVMVVANNARPIVTLNKASTDADPSGLSSSDDAPLGEQQLLRDKLYTTNVRGATTIMATIHAGNDPFADEVSFSYDMGAAGKADDVVAVEITPKTGATNTWEVKLTPLMAGMQNVYVTVKDKFGATAETPGPGELDDDGAVQDDERAHQTFQFVAFVNTVPKLDMALDDKTILAGNTHDYMIASHFDTAEASVTAGPKIGDMEKPAEAPALSTADAPANDVPEGGVIGAADRNNDAACSATSSDTSVASVAHQSAPGIDITEAVAGAPTFTELLATQVIRVTGESPGKAVITITCRDFEGSETGTATVTVRAVRS